MLQSLASATSGEPETFLSTSDCCATIALSRLRMTSRVMRSAASGAIGRRTISSFMESRSAQFDYGILEVVNCGRLAWTHKNGGAGMFDDRRAVHPITGTQRSTAHHIH